MGVDRLWLTQANIRQKTVATTTVNSTGSFIFLNHMYQKLRFRVIVHALSTEGWVGVWVTGGRSNKMSQHGLLVEAGVVVDLGRVKMFEGPVSGSLMADGLADLEVASTFEFSVFVLILSPYLVVAFHRPLPPRRTGASCTRSQTCTSAPGQTYLSARSVPTWGGFWCY